MIVTTKCRTNSMFADDAANREKLLWCKEVEVVLLQIELVGRKTLITRITSQTSRKVGQLSADNSNINSSSKKKKKIPNRPRSVTREL